MHGRLEEEWKIRLAAIAELEAEIGVPLRQHLLRAIAALEQESYDRRIERAREWTTARDAIDGGS